MSNQIAKLEHELAQLKKAHIGPKSERSKMPRLPGKPSTPEERLAKRRAQAADRAQTETVRTEHKVPLEERTCPSCGNDKLKPIGEGRTTTVFEFVPARFVRHEHVQEVLRCRCGDYVVTAAAQHFLHVLVADEARRYEFEDGRRPALADRLELVVAAARARALLEWDFVFGA